MNSRLENSFLAFTEVMRKIGREVTRKSDGPTVAQASRERLRDSVHSGGLVGDRPIQRRARHLQAYRCKRPDDARGSMIFPFRQKNSIDAVGGD